MSLSLEEEQRLKKWLEMLKSTDANMAKIAADKLGEIGNTMAVMPLIEALQRRTATVAAAAAQALGRINDKRALSPLIEALRSHQDVMVQTAAADGLGMMRAVQAIAPLSAVIDDYLETFKNDRFNLTRGMRRGLFTTCIHSLRQIGTLEAKRIANNAERTESLL